jgi:hypothetical protein
LGGNGLVPGRHRGIRQNAGSIAQPKGVDLHAQPGVIAIARIEYHHGALQARRAGPAQLLGGNLRLGFEDDLLRHISLASARRVVRPFLRQVKPIAHRGRLAWRLAIDSETAAWQLSCLPGWPQYCRATPTECMPFLGKPVSSMIQASIGPSRSIAGSTISHTLASTLSSDHEAWPTKCSND